MSTRPDDLIMVSDAPDVPGLRFRHFRGEADYPVMAEVMNASGKADGDERVFTADVLSVFYAAADNFNPITNLILAEIDGTLIGFGRVLTGEEAGVGHVNSHWGYLRPEWRHRRIGTAILGFIQQTSKASLPAGEPLSLESIIWETDEASRYLLEKNGYAPNRYAALMVRPDLENIPDLPLPSSIAVRPVTQDQFRAIYDAEVEAFRDHPGPFIDYDFSGFVEEAKVHDPALWRVAWEGDQVAGMVRAFINHEENQEKGRKRGYTENISVRQPWRSKGIAKALLAQSLSDLKGAGMTEAALNVQTANPHGALKLYESMGYEIVKMRRYYRKEAR